MRAEKGFTLVELSIVILIMGLILGGIAMPLSAQRENLRVRDVREVLEYIEEALQGYALANGYLPCPATPASAGLAATAGGGCAVQHGFVPASTLGLPGSRNDDNLLLDPWGSPFRYSVSAADVDGDGYWDFTTGGELRDVGMPDLAPDLSVCSTAAGTTASACGSTTTTLSSRAPMIVYSMGKDWASFGGADQLENAGATLGGGPSGTNYPVAADLVFVSRSRSGQSGSEFDDVVVWMSPLSLYHELVISGQLP
ncbi:MAG: type II secretion system protein [Gammaproteobacteria bacterium]|nr:type II secretion system protein [Gammaproteobacteria bacterium]